MSAPGWPAQLAYGPVLVRPLHPRDAEAWRRVRAVNYDWLTPWDATMPPVSSGAVDASGGWRGGGRDRQITFAQLARKQRRQARAGKTLPFVIEVNGRFAGQVTVSNIVRGSALFGSIGYWLDHRFAGQGVMPVAVALVIDHCFGPVGLHRVEIAVRPENSNSLRVVEKLGLREVGFAPRYLHIDGDWRDHRLFGLTVEECPGGVLARLLESRGGES